MSVGKQCAARSQRIDVGRVRQWMPVETTDPVILVVNRNEQNVRFFRSVCWCGR